MIKFWDAVAWALFFISERFRRADHACHQLGWHCRDLRELTHINRKLARRNRTRKAAVEFARQLRLQSDQDQAERFMSHLSLAFWHDFNPSFTDRADLINNSLDFTQLPD